MASQTLQPATELGIPLEQRVELALKGLHQLEAMLPLAQQAVEDEGHVEVTLGFLGRFRQLNDVVMRLLCDTVYPDEFERLRVQILGE